MINKKFFIIFIFFVFMLLIITGCSSKNTNNNVSEETTEQETTELKQYEFMTDDLASLNLNKTFKLENSYIKNITKPMNRFYIDENNVLWGYGLNSYGQLGIGTVSDIEDFTTEPVKIADNVVHVDYSGEYFMIYLTTDGRLYGAGANLYGVMLEPIQADYDLYPEKDIVSVPKLLMEDVAYARCGYNALVVLKNDGSVWTWGKYKTTASYGEMLIDKPTKILDNAVYVTSGINTAGAILKDNSLWTWGNNTMGQCGTEITTDYIETPVKAAKNVKMVWFDALSFGSYLTQITSQFEPLDILRYENTFIELNDNSLLVCGKNVGDTTRYMDIYGDASAGDLTEMGIDPNIVCSSQFMPLVIKERQH